METSQVRENVRVALIEQAKNYITIAGKVSSKRIWIGLVIVFSISNLIISYLKNIPVLNSVLEFIMELAEWGGNMIPSALLPKALMTWQTNMGQWAIGIVMATLALLPYVIGWLISKDPKKSGGCWIVLIWYTADSIIFARNSIIVLTSAFSSDISIWETVLFIFWKVAESAIRIFVLAEMIEGINVPKKLKKEWDKMVELSFKWYAVINGEEEAKKQPREAAELFSAKTITEVAKQMDKERNIVKTYSQWQN